MKLNFLRLVADKVSHHSNVVRLVLTMEDGTTEEDVYRKGLIWLETPQGALVLLTRVEEKSGNELFVYGLAGKGIIKDGREIMSDLKEIARALDCSKIGGNSVRPAMERVYRRLGMRPAYTYFNLEV
jgi:hypothetical protein